MKIVLVLFNIMFLHTLSFGVCTQDIDMGGKSITNIKSDVNELDSLATPDGLLAIPRPFKYVYIIFINGLSDINFPEMVCQGFEDRTIINSPDERFLMIDIDYDDIYWSDRYRTKNKKGDGWRFPQDQYLDDAVQQLYSKLYIDKSEFGKYTSTGRGNKLSSISGSSTSGMKVFTADPISTYYLSDPDKRIVMTTLGGNPNSGSSSNFLYYLRNSTGKNTDKYGIVCMKHTNTKIEINGVKYPLD